MFQGHSLWRQIISMQIIYTKKLEKNNFKNTENDM